MNRDKGEKAEVSEILYSRRISSVVAITPVFNEEIYTIQHFNNRLNEVKNLLVNRSISFRHFFLDDAALNLPREEVSTLVTHTTNTGLATTLIDGYEAALALHPKPDLIVRLDSQEHSPYKIIEIVDHMMNTEAEAVFLPIWYKTIGEPSPLATEIYEKLATFEKALEPLHREEILNAYIQFPLGFQAFTSAGLEKLLPLCKEGLQIFEKMEGRPATWGMDLLMILLATRTFPKQTDFIWGGWSTPWKSNRGVAKTDDQKQRADIMIRVAQEILSKAA